MSSSNLGIENWHQLICRLYWAYEGPVEPRFQHGAYQKDLGMVAWLIIRGHTTLTFGRNRERCDAGHWFFPKGETWSQDFSDDAEIISLRFAAHWPDETTLFDRSRSLIVPDHELPRLTSLARRLARLSRTAHVGDERVSAQMPKTLESHLNIQRLFLSWMTTYVDLMRSRDVPINPYHHLDERVGTVIDYIERAEVKEPLREADLAKLAGVSKSHLNRLFATNTGKSPAEYLEDRRIRAARSALLESTRSVKTIAYELGFNSLSHFSTWTTKKLGVSPRELRKKNALAGKSKAPLLDTSVNPHYTHFQARARKNRGVKPQNLQKNQKGKHQART